MVVFNQWRRWLRCSRLGTAAAQPTQNRNEDEEEKHGKEVAPVVFDGSPSAAHNVTSSGCDVWRVKQRRQSAGGWNIGETRRRLRRTEVNGWCGGWKREREV
ncbi:unnamed protein product [Lactuca virosa]|uniref:Uncharacterized protein n=1 Tax=Lactuca virosa TaxID=75947 RepID=A0AAU9M308_9ASTR|nr:unnamed protein product [Lactuca virosa]